MYWKFAIKHKFCVGVVKEVYICVDCLFWNFEPAGSSDVEEVPLNFNVMYLFVSLCCWELGNMLFEVDLYVRKADNKEKGKSRMMQY